MIRHVRWMVPALAALTLAMAMPAWAAAKPKAAPAAAPQVHRMTAFLAYEPAWYDSGTKLVFLANQNQGEPVHVFMWDLVAGKLARFSKAPATRHSLTAHDGRAAYVERTNAPPAADLSAMDPALAPYTPQPGPDMLMVQKAGTNDFEMAFRGWILAGSVNWSPDGRRLAFVTMDRRGVHRLALLEPGAPVQMITLDQDYQLSRTLNWVSPREVLLRARPLAQGPARLLKVGKDGIQPFPDGAEPKLSPDGKWLLTRASEAGGVAFRGLGAVGKPLHSTASAYAWGAKADQIFLALGTDIVAYNTAGKVVRRWPKVADYGISHMTVSPDGRALAFGRDSSLAIILLN